jgi:hypothetical protein
VFFHTGKLPLQHIVSARFLSIISLLFVRYLLPLLRLAFCAAYPARDAVLITAVPLSRLTSLPFLRGALRASIVSSTTVLLSTLLYPHAFARFVSPHFYCSHLTRGRHGKQLRSTIACRLPSIPSARLDCVSEQAHSATLATHALPGAPSPRLLKPRPTTKPAPKLATSVLT